MKCRLEIRRNSDGKIVVHSDRDWEADGSDDYMWSDGNFGCDCNRGDFFHQAEGTSEHDDEPCGDERYSVRLTDKTTGEVVYQDRNWIE